MPRILLASLPVFVSLLLFTAPMAVASTISWTATVTNIVDPNGFIVPNSIAIEGSFTVDDTDMDPSAGTGLYNVTDFIVIVGPSAAAGAGVTFSPTSIDAGQVVVDDFDLGAINPLGIDVTPS